jgi:hypothetical protein
MFLQSPEYRPRGSRVTGHAELEMSEGKAVDYSIPKDQAAFEEADALYKMINPEIEWREVSRMIRRHATRIATCYFTETYLS